MKPIIVLPVGAMDDAEIAKLTENGICVVVAKDPAAVQFIDTIPTITSRTEVEHAAIQFTRKVLSPNFWERKETRELLCGQFFDVLKDGSVLDQKPGRAEREKQVFDSAKEDELRRLAREEAKAERAAAKAAAAKK